MPHHAVIFPSRSEALSRKALAEILIVHHWRDKFRKTCN